MAVPTMAPQTGVQEEDVPKYKGLFQTAKEKVEKLRKWKDNIEEPTDEFDKDLHTVLRHCGDVFDILRDDQRFNELAEELAALIVDVRNHLGPSIMPLAKYYMFSRGVFEVAGKTIIPGQYYEEIPYYGPPRPADQDEGPLTITKFYEWKIINSPREQLCNQSSFPIQCTYHLEKGEMVEPYYVLGKAAPGIHASIEMYHGGAKPSFFALEAKIVKILLNEQQGNQVGFAAASYTSAGNQMSNNASEP